jgi:hypothetical protein
MNRNDPEYLKLENDIRELDGLRKIAQFSGHGSAIQREIERLKKRVEQQTLRLVRKQRRTSLRTRSSNAAEVPLSTHPGSGTETRFAHSLDFRTVVLNGETYRLTSRQAQVVEILHFEHQQGPAEVGTAYILDRLGTPNSRLQDTFKRLEGWRTLIVPGKKRGTVRLNLPTNFKCPSCRAGASRI